ncbi:sugar phosphate isomerase/epimerase family protein [Pseudomonas sp. CGJS7]|uniref:sugar phosphate isomerase/epimerase family protein n=1 Tax=Pseudomonas sp. CGJS7 TaxID=3109348 RepID=UPI00300A6326
MKLGVFTPLFAKLSLQEVLRKVQSAGLDSVELGAGGFPGADHLDVEGLLASADRARDFRSLVADHGLIVSALSCHGNPLHPDPQIAQRDDAILRRTVRLAERLQVPVVITFSGCPGDSDNSRIPNWITSPWPPEMLRTLEWQWNEKAIPYWRDATAYAREHGIRIALEPHPNFLVHNVDTALHLRAEAGDHLGVNLDPSHMLWRGVDMPQAIRALGPAIFHFHAKDVALDRANTAVHGVVDARSYRDIAQRAWSFRSVGHGHDLLVWKQIMQALRVAGYDYVVSLEHEDALMSTEQGFQTAIDTLKLALLRDPPDEPWWT